MSIKKLRTLLPRLETRKLTFIAIALLLCTNMAFAATIQLNPDQGVVGTSVIVTGSDFTPGETATIDFGQFPIVAFAIVNADGTFQATPFSVPAQANVSITIYDSRDNKFVHLR